MPVVVRDHLAKAADVRNMKHLITPDLGSSGNVHGSLLNVGGLATA
jgi:hypothetical protein